MERIGTPDELFHAGDPATNTKGTVVTDDWLNAVQEELANAVEAFGVTLNPADRGQLADALLANLAPILGSSGNVFRVAQAVGADDAVPLGQAQSLGDGLKHITAGVAGDALTLTLNPTTLRFRSATLADGTVTTIATSAAISLTVSPGSTLGTTNGVEARLAVLAINNAGTVELAVANANGSTVLDETVLITTTAEGGAGAADSANTIYSATARANVPYVVVGYVDITEAVAGTWATGPTKIQGAGGRLAASSSEVLAGTDKLKMVTPAGLLAGLLGAGTYSANGYITIPYRDASTGVRRSLIVQWGGVSIPTGVSSAACDWTFPISFPAGCLRVIASIGIEADDYDVNSYRTCRQDVSVGAPTQNGVEAQAFLDNNTTSGRRVQFFAIGY